MRKDRIAKGFNFLAPFYDRLAHLIIGKDIVLSQFFFMGRFSQSKRLLILGGGSGWMLNGLCSIYPYIEIDYIDLSSRMMNRARKRMKYNGHVNFIQGTEDDLSVLHYDGVITNFFLDMFVEQGQCTVIEKIKRSLNYEALWLVTDFVSEKKKHSIKLWCMYRFFRIVAKIEAPYLSDWRRHMLEAGFKLSESKKFNNGFIVSNIYQLEPASQPTPPL